MADLMDELLATFRVEAAEYLDILNQSLLVLERQGDNYEELPGELVQDAFRAAHSLKGAARAVGLEPVEQLAHALESILQEVRDADLHPTSAAFDTMYDTLDTIQQLLAGEAADYENLHSRLLSLTTGSSQPAPATTARVMADAQTNISDTIRVDLAKLDHLMAEVGELVVNRMRTEQRQTDVRDLRLLLDRWGKQWHEFRSALIRHTDSPQFNDPLQRQNDLLQEIEHRFAQLEQNVRRDGSRLSVVTDSLQDRIRRVRMIPFQTMQLTLERVVRDAAHFDGKEVDLHIEGAGVEIDKKVLETLKDPLLHLLRNAIAHGIEPPETRRQLGKPPVGQLTVQLHQRSSEVHISIQDDGRGFDLAALASAYEKRRGHGAIDGPVENPIDIAFLPGVSTVQSPTELAGRGVGLDVVREKLAAIQGRVSVETTAGAGSTIRLMVPISLAMTRGLLVRIGKEQYALPLHTVERIVPVSDPIMIGGQPMLRINETTVRLLTLAALLERATDTTLRAGQHAIILNITDQRFALLVDDVITEQELAVKSLTAPLNRVRNVAGAALLGTGQPIIMLHPADLLQTARNVGVSDLVVETKTEQTLQHLTVLVVDDSITTRTLEKNILEAAGYTVITAINGVEAVDRLKQHQIDVVVSDVQMPQMDGLELTRQLRGSSATAGLPIILVTSLESRDERQAGLHAGADAYIVKRGFDQAELLTTIQRLL